MITYSRNRFIVNLLPLLQQATTLRRVVTAFAAGKEGPVDVNDFQSRKVPALSARGHASSLVTLSLEALGKKAPNVTFIHDFPGPVKSNFLRGGQGAAIFALNAVFKLVSPMMSWYSNQECGERHLFLATSARYVRLERLLGRMRYFEGKSLFCLSRVSCGPGFSHKSWHADSKNLHRYPPGSNGDLTSGVPCTGEVTVATGTNGEKGSGVYSVELEGESSGPKVQELLAKFRKEAVVEKLWKHTEEEFRRITGLEAA